MSYTTVHTGVSHSAQPMQRCDYAIKHTNTIHPIYRAADIRAWELRWFAQGNSSYGLMQQAALLLSERIYYIMLNKGCQQALIWCGVGNNGGDGYLLAHYLNERGSASGIKAAIYAPMPPITDDAKCAQAAALATGVIIYDKLSADVLLGVDVHIDALFGNGLNRPLDTKWQALIGSFNHQRGHKITIDIPSGLHPDTGAPLPFAVMADDTLCLMGLKMGLMTAQGKQHAGTVQLLPLIPADRHLPILAWFDTRHPKPKQPMLSHAHKGDFGHVLIIGGHANMGGAVILSAMAAMAVGAGKATVICHKANHSAILSAAPNLMVQDIDSCDIDALLQSADALCFGMGLGRDSWAQAVYDRLMPALISLNIPTVVDADALYWLAKSPCQLGEHIIATPHSAEAGRLLGVTANAIEADRVSSIYKLQARYAGSWVLKGAGSLTLVQDTLHVCAFGSVAMATAGMGDVLSGVIAGLKAQAHWQASLAEAVTQHALAADWLTHQRLGAKNLSTGNIRISAQAMISALEQLNCS